jgi:hypothetical protein
MVELSTTICCPVTYDAESDARKVPRPGEIVRFSPIYQVVLCYLCVYSISPGWFKTEFTSVSLEI